MTNRIQYLQRMPDTHQLNAYTIRPLDERIKALQTSESDIVFLYKRIDPGIFRYRVYNIINSINSRKEGEKAIFFQESELDTVLANMRHIRKLVLVRIAYDNYQEVIDHAKKEGIEIIYDLDDYLFDPKLTKFLFREQLHTEHSLQYWTDYIENRYMAIQRADKITTTTKPMKTALERVFRQKVHVVPNTFNMQQVSVSVQCAELKRKFPADDDILLGYFSGSYTHNLDFEILVPSLSALLAKDSRLKIVLGGAIHVPPALARFKKQVITVSLQNFENLQIPLGLVDINLIPLVDNKFNIMKSELKFFESAIASTPSIATNLPVYQDIHKHDSRSIVLVDNDADSWTATMSRLISDPALRHTMTLHAINTANELFSPRRIEDALPVWLG